MNVFLRLWCLIFILFAGTPSDAAQLFHRKVNQWKDNKYDGLWISWSDSLKEKMESRGRYRNGKEIGTWKFFYEDGTLRRRERYTRTGISTVYFYPNGKQKSKGKAIVEYDEEFLHYYYQGDWRYYSESGKLNQIITYDKGVEIAAETFERQGDR